MLSVQVLVKTQRYDSLSADANLALAATHQSLLLWIFKQQASRCAETKESKGMQKNKCLDSSNGRRTIPAHVNLTVLIWFCRYSFRKLMLMGQNGQHMDARGWFYNWTEHRPIRAKIPIVCMSSVVVKSQRPSQDQDQSTARARLWGGENQVFEEFETEKRRSSKTVTRFWDKTLKTNLNTNAGQTENKHGCCSFAGAMVSTLSISTSWCLVSAALTNITIANVIALSSLKYYKKKMSAKRNESLAVQKERKSFCRVMCWVCLESQRRGVGKQRVSQWFVLWCGHWLSVSTVGSAAVSAPDSIMVNGSSWQPISFQTDTMTLRGWKKKVRPPWSTVFTAGFTNSGHTLCVGWTRSGNK